MNKEIYLIRHVETTWNEKKVLQGQLDSSLTEKGMEQAKKLSNRMIKINPDSFYSSNLKRASETANIINKFIKKDITLLPEMSERHWGIFQGANWQKIKTFFPKQYKYYRNDTKNYVIPNGESYKQVFNRSINCLLDLIHETEDQKIAIVTHGGIISILIREILSLPYDSYRKLLISNSSITKLVYNDFGFSIVSIGDIAHLEE